MRVKLLRENVLNVIPQVCSERGKLITESYRETEGYPMVIRRAKALEKILANMTIYINDEELIVGNQASSPRAAPIFPEFSVNWLEKELGEFSNRDLDKFLVPEQTIDEIKEICAFWKGKTVQDRAVSLYSLLLGKKNLSYDLEFPEINSVVAHIISVGEGYGHIIPNYQKLMAKGIKGIVNEAQEILKDLKIIKNQDDVEKSVFLQAVITSCNAATRFIERFAEEAKSLKKKETSLQRKEELEKIADVCTWIKGNPPRNFWEALQLILFIHFIIQIESNGHAVSLGRLDQYLYPFYQRDIKEGRITEEEAVELLECSLIKCHELIKTRSWRCTPYKTGYPLFQTISLGGTKRDGSDATNELSYLFLKAVAEVKIPQPTLVVLIHNKTPNKFLIECWRTVRQHGGGMPGFFNNEVAVLSLVRAGASVEDAREWAVVGCSEIIIPGKGNSILNGGGCYINTLKILELILKNSISFNTFDDLKRVFRQELAFYMKYVPLLVSVTVKAHKELAPTPFLSSLIDYRLEIGKDTVEGGGPNLNSTLVEGHGLVNVGDSLAAIKKLVFDEKVITLEELKEALNDNFEGDKGNFIRKKLREAPKFGNDDDYVDLIVKELTNWFVQEVESYTPSVGGKYGVTLQTITANVPEGKLVGATPDGRKACEPLADNISPSAGADKKGPIAVLKSVAKLNHEIFNQGTILNIRLSLSVLEDEEKLRKVATLVKSFFYLGGFQVQFNVISNDTLKDAQKNPSKYPNLMVKVAGYSAMFNTINRELQDQIIARNEYSKL